jgi:hypothetical protein
MDSQQPESGPVARPSSRAVEAPRAIAPPARQPGRSRLGVVLAAVATLGLLTAVVVRTVARGDSPVAGAATPAPTASSPLATPAPATERALVGGVGPASQVEISPSGDRVLAIRERGVDIWRLDGSRIAWLAVDGDRIDGASWSQDGRRVLVWGPDGTVRLWNAETGAMMQTVQAGMGKVTRAELVDDAHALTIGATGVRRIWDLRSGEVRIDRAGSPSSPAPVRINAVTPDGEWRAFVDPSGDVHLARVI